MAGMAHRDRYRGGAPARTAESPGGFRPKAVWGGSIH
jgi:hypothetical protein